MVNSRYKFTDIIKIEALRIRLFKAVPASQCHFSEARAILGELSVHSCTTTLITSPALKHCSPPNSD